LINFVRLTVSDVQSTDQHDVREIVVNRHYISHLIRRYEHTVVHFGNGDRPINVRESPAEILTMELWRLAQRRADQVVALRGRSPATIRGNDEEAFTQETDRSKPDGCCLRAPMNPRRPRSSWGCPGPCEQGRGVPPLRAASRSRSCPPPGPEQIGEQDDDLTFWDHTDCTACST
jgi:hypothetical protein